jgi:hypothetical protein
VADQSDVRRIIMSLPETAEADDRFGFTVLSRGSKHKEIAWAWNERVEPGEPKVPNVGVVAIRVANLQEKDALIAADPAKFFTEPHYNHFPAVLVRLAEVGTDELEELITDAWRHMAPRRLVKAFDQDQAAR